MRSYLVGTGRTVLCLLPLLGWTACASQSVGSRPLVIQPTATPTARSQLPVRRVRIYESGVAEFERSGQLHAATTALPIPESDIDDVLRTLVIRRGVNLVRAYSASFDTVSLARVTRTRANLPTESKPGSEYAEFVQSLKGESIELSVQGTRLRGRLIELAPIEQTAKIDEGDAEDAKPGRVKGKPASATTSDKSKQFDWRTFELTLLLENGAIERLYADKVEWLRPLDPVIMARLDSAVAATSGRAHERTRVLEIASDSAEPISLTYVAESPVARITYRLHAGQSGETNRLQGLALVHNATDEPWGSVAIEISNDDLDSNIVPFSAPRYWDRPLHATPESKANVMRQLNQATADSLLDSGNDSRAAAGDNDSTPKMRTYPNTNTPSQPNHRSRVARQGHTAYTYAVSTNPSIGARSSALLPFLEAEVKVERGVWFGRNSNVGRSVVRVQNTTSRPLPAGMVSVFDAGHFVGETEMSQLESGRFGYFDYANELKLALTKMSEASPAAAYRGIVWSGDSLHMQVSEHLERTVEFTNASDRDQTAFLSIDVSNGAVVKGGDGLDTDYAGRPIVVAVKVPANGHVERTITVEQEREDETDVSNLESDTLTQFAEQPGVPAAIRSVLDEGVKLLKASKAMSERKEQLEATDAQLVESSSRLSIADASAPPGIVARFLQIEVQRSELQKQTAALDKLIERQLPLLRKVMSRLPQK